MKDFLKFVGLGIGVSGTIIVHKSGELWIEQIKLQKEIEFKRLEYQKQANQDNLELQKQKLELEKDKLEFEKLKSFNSDNIFNYNDELKDSFDNAKNLEVFKVPNNLKIDLNSPLEDYNFDSSNLYLETSRLLEKNMSLTYICFSSVTIILIISISFSYLVNIYGDKLLNKLPKFIHPLFRFYQRYLVYPILFNFSIILVCQSVGLMLSLYIYYT